MKPELSPSRSCSVPAFSDLMLPRAVQIIEYNDHAHLISKAGSVISSRSPSRAFRCSDVYYTEP